MSEHEVIPESITTRTQFENVQHHDDFGRTVEIKETEMIRISGLCKLCQDLVRVKMMVSKHKPAKNVEYLTQKHQEDLCRKMEPWTGSQQNKPQELPVVAKVLPKKKVGGRPAKRG